MEKGLLPGDLAGELVGAGILMFPIDFDTGAEAEDRAFMTTEEAAEALLFILLSLNSLNNREPAVLDILAPCTGAGTAQLWSAGNRCEGQNCS